MLEIKMEKELCIKFSESEYKILEKKAKFCDLSCADFIKKTVEKIEIADMIKICEETETAEPEKLTGRQQVQKTLINFKTGVTGILGTLAK